MFEREYLGVYVPVPRIGEIWEMQRYGKWIKVEILDIRQAREGWNEFRARYVNELGVIEENWAMGPMRPEVGKN